MYTNIAKKLMTLAKVIGIIGLIAAAVFAIILVIGLIDGDDEFWIMGLIGVGGGIVLWISSWPLYAFGQITDDVHAIRHAPKPQPTEKISTATNYDVELPDL